MLSKSDIFSITSDLKFNKIALAHFYRQYQKNHIYKKFVDALNHPFPKHFSEILHLPIETFKNQMVVCNDCLDTQIVFESSGTTETIPSKNFLNDTEYYIEVFTNQFVREYGSLDNLTILGLLPSYLERTNSSLVFMVEKLQKQSKSKYNGFYLNDFKSLRNTIEQLNFKNLPYLLIGVSFGLLAFIENEAMPISENGIIMETGGMKGRRKELIRTELHKTLSKGFNTTEIHSEYGMTELMSQAYSKGDGWFSPPPWMKISIVDPYDPFNILPFEEQGIIQITDLANWHSCPFLKTSDLGKMLPDGRFQVLGRTDSSDIRGCNLMISF